METPLITIITPTTGHQQLLRLLTSLYIQEVEFEHILLWDGIRELNESITPNDIKNNALWNRTYHIEIPGNFIQGAAAGSALRAVGLMAAQGKFVTFADTDVWYEVDHLEMMVKHIVDKNWAFCRRKIWSSEGEYLGIDNFESVGNSKSRKVPYILVDNNTMIFKREYGVKFAMVYRETNNYNDDRLMTKFLYEYAGIPGESKNATINQVCPTKLESMFRKYCTEQK